jgi:hypothetical protein
MWRFAVALGRGVAARLGRWTMAEQNNRERRQGARYASAAQTTWRPAAAEPAAEGGPAAVHDVSFGGVGLRLDRPLPCGALLHVQLPGAGPSRPPLLACVAHAHPAAEGAWAVGCSFIRDLSDQELRSFLESGSSVAPGPAQ